VPDGSLEAMICPNTPVSPTHRLAEAHDIVSKLAGLP
jgi:hypothetical protein